MKRALVLVVAACGGGGGGGGGAPDGGADAVAIDAPGSRFEIEVLPAGPVATPIGATRMFEATVSHVGPGTTGAIEVTLTGSPDYQITDNDCTTLAAGTCTIRIALQPTTVTTLIAQLVVSAEPGGTGSADLIATGLQANVLAITPERIDFGGRPVGQTSAPLSAIITNTHAVATGPLAVTIEAGTPYTLDASACIGAVLPPLGSCSFTVTYTPTATVPLGSGGDFADITASATPGGQAFALAAGGGVTLMMSPWQFEFPTTAVGATSPAHTLTVSNSQAFDIGPLTTDTQLLGTQFVIQQDTCAGQTLAPLEVCSYSVVFAPTAPGTVVAGFGTNAPDVGAFRNAAFATVVGSTP